MKVATKNDVKSLNRAFCAALDKSLSTKPKSADALIGVKTHSSTKPNNKYAYKIPRDLTIKV